MPEQRAADLGVACGRCGSRDVFMLTCGQGGCSWVIGMECRGCGALSPVRHADEPCNTENATHAYDNYLDERYGDA